MSIKNLLKAAVLTGFFLSTLWLVAGLPVIFNSPDESANFLFATEFAREQNFVIEEPLNEELGGIIHPRSMLVIGERIMPRSFLGLPVTAGLVGLLFGERAMLFLTPALAVLAVLAWRSVVRQLSEDSWLADVSAFLFMVHPAFWYYSGRTMMHNIGFLAFLIFAFWFGLAGLKEKNWRRRSIIFVFSGAAAALALAFRASEVLWVVPLGALLFWWSRRVISWKMLAAFFLGFVLVTIPFAVINQELYGAFLKTGYQVNGSVPAEVFATEASEEIAIEVQSVEEPRVTVLDKVMSVLFPFGIAEKAIVRHAWQYGFALYPWMSAIAFAGVVMVLAHLKKRSHPLRWKRLLSILTALSIWLGVVYGSWTFHDNPDPTIFSLGNSYVRYWLPLFLLSTPFGAFALIKSMQTVKYKSLKMFTTGFILVTIAALSAHVVFFGDDGFVHTRNALMTFEEKRQEVIARTEEDAIVIVDRSDKFIFPHRRVVTPLREESTYRAMPELVNSAPLYYFGITLPEEDVEYLNTAKLAGMNLRIEHIATVLDESLYRIIPAS